MIRSLRDSKAHLSELVERASQGEDVLITVRGKVRARLTRPLPARPSVDADAWQRRISQVNAKYRTKKRGRPIDQVLDEMREDRE